MGNGEVFYYFFNSVDYSSGVSWVHVLILAGYLISSVLDLDGIINGRITTTVAII